mmetsp:Transcript_26270/g.64858  ORF Transcript_26270/g.64858 Transcript_26270/m.64858 type:complete len:270 (+) Transcript_26270:1901-2710(+)
MPSQSNSSIPSPFSSSITFCTDIWFVVSVPVLSEQMIEVHPSVSTAGRCLISAFFLASLRVPSARHVVTTAGSPSGIAATASTIEILKKYIAPFIHTAHVRSSLPTREIPFFMNLGRLIAQHATHTTEMMRVSRSPNLSSFSFSGESLSSVSVSALAIFPISVSEPVLITTPLHLPYTRSVPEKRQLSFMLSSASMLSDSHAASFGTPAASPVRAACSALTEVLCKHVRRRSAGTLSPTFTSTISPGTSSLASIISTLPLRSTLAWAGL